MDNQNLALKVRTELNLTPTEASKLLFDYKGKQAYTTWNRWETGERQIPLSTHKYFMLVIKIIGLYGVDEGIKFIKSED